MGLILLALLKKHILTYVHTDKYISITYLINSRYQRNKTQDLLDTILSIQPKESGGGGGESREASVYRQSKEMLDKLPPNFDPVEVKER